MPKNEAHVRLDRFLAKNLPGYSRSRLQQLIRTGFVTLNGRAIRARHLVHTGDKIELTEPPLEKIDNQPEPIPLEILFEDKDIVVINKQSGLVVHPGAGHPQHTLVNALLSHCTTLSGIGGKERPGIIHRLGASRIVEAICRAHGGKGLSCARRRKITQTGRHDRRKNRTTSIPSTTNEGDFLAWTSG